jgi:hypothetical protein
LGLWSILTPIGPILIRWIVKRISAASAIFRKIFLKTGFHKSMSILKLQHVSGYNNNNNNKVLLKSWSECLKDMT